ncbi:prolyl oligopeptidase [Pavlovales sp. CCMP2436]|nr:prolyl oligopeptidase [Pavlovales sp. CCMP2436]
MSRRLATLASGMLLARGASVSRAPSAFTPLVAAAAGARRGLAAYDSPPGAGSSPGSRARAAVALGLLAATGASAAASAEGVPTPPIAPRRPHIVKLGKVAGEDRGEHASDPPKELVDDFFWLRDDKRQNPEVLAHLHAENAYTEAMTSHLEQFRAKLYRELLSHVRETDDSCPYPHGAFDYYTRTVEGLSYVLHCRRPKGAGKAAEQLLLDENEVAAAHPDHCDVGALEPSPSHGLLAYSLDGKGYETYAVHFKNLSGGEHLPDVLEETAGDLVWGGDDSSVYYTTFDEAHRPCAVWRHEMGRPQAEDVKLYEDSDGLFYVSLGKSRDGRLVVVESQSSETSEVHLLEVRRYITCR